MSDLLKQHFRATNGLDAGGNKVINVALADRTTMSDGINVEYMIQENTIQPYDSTRGYLKGFAVTYEKRIWVANRDIAKPSGAFNQANWQSLRVDPKWEYINVGSINLEPGVYINADSRANELEFTLPPTPQDGDTIVIRDIGGQPGFNSINVIAANQSIAFNNLQLRNLKLTHPFAMYMFTFTNRLWQTTMTDLTSIAKIISPGTEVKLQAGEKVVYRYTNNSVINTRLPKYANTNDIISFADLDGSTPLYHLNVSTFDSATSIGTVGQKTTEFRTKGEGFLVYDDSDKLWRIFNGDLQTRLRLISNDVTLMPNESVMVTGSNNTETKTVNINLPTNVAIGDTVTIALNYMRKGHTVNIKPATGDTIATTKNILQFPKRSSYPPDGAWTNVSQLSFNGNSDYVPVLKLSYIEDGNSKYWVVAENNPTIERVDSTNDSTRARVGVIALASQAQANIDYENSPQKELAITPETLANRYSTETRRGIARIATTAQVNQDTTFSFLDDVIITPKKLNERTATETRRGIAEIATQAEANGSTDDITIVTPKKLHNRIASPTQTGILALVQSGGTANTDLDRSKPGTGIYSLNDYLKAVTPKTLREYIATENASGSVWLARESEVINGTAASDGYPTVVTPEMLHRKTTTTARIGLIQLATQAETNAMSNASANKAVTPATLNARVSSETQTGISRYATQNEFDTGTSGTILASPLKIKTRFNSTDRTSVVSDSGLVESGTLWDHYTLDIQTASNTQRGTARLATQNEVNAGTAGSYIVTPTTLAAKKATETADGIIRIADQGITVAGTDINKAVSPRNLKYVVQTESTWQATPTLRGFVKLSQGDGTWNGNDTAGSTLPDNGYASTGVAVSPYELNLTLKHYLPKLGKAYDSSRLDGQTSDKWVRRDIDQSIQGKYTFAKDIIGNAAISAVGQISTTSGDIKSIATATSSNSHFRLLNSDNDERGLIYAEPQTEFAGAVKLRVKNGSSSTASKNTFTFNGNGSLDIPNEANAINFNASNKLSTNGNVIVSGIQALKVEGSNMIVGAQSNRAFIRTDTDAYIQNSAGSHVIINTNNYSTHLDGRYVKKTGDTISGRLTINSAISVVGNAAWADLATPNSDSVGTWSAEITNQTQYNKLPGYAVPVQEQDPLNPGTYFVVRYDYVKAPGTLSQHGVGTNNVYQIWAPRPTSNTGINALAQTFWIRQMNPITGKFDSWGRMYTSNNPPTAGEIGATSAVGTTVKNMTVTDWFKIGKVKIYPDEATQTVKFEWVG